MEVDHYFLLTQQSSASGHSYLISSAVTIEKHL